MPVSFPTVTHTEKKSVERYAKRVTHTHSFTGLLNNSYQGPLWSEAGTGTPRERRPAKGQLARLTDVSFAKPVTSLLAIVRRDYGTSFTKTDGQETDCPADRYVHLPERGRQRRGVTVRDGGGTEAGEKSVALTQILVLSNSGLFYCPRNLVASSCRRHFDTYTVSPRVILIRRLLLSEGRPGLVALAKYRRKR